MENPCRKDCPDRSPVCHGKCDKYLAFSKERQAENEARYNFNQIMYENEIRRREKMRAISLWRKRRHD